MKLEKKLSYALSRVTQAQIAWILLVLLILIYSVWMCQQVILRYDTFIATAFDLGNMDQAVWNTLHGHLFQFTNQGDNYSGPPTRLAIHVEPILLPISLLYLIQPDPRTLLVFQTLALAAGALPVFMLARKYLPAWPLFAVVLAAAYLFSPALLGMNLFDFHPVALATPLLLFALLALTYRRYGWMLLTCVLAAACKEDIPFTIALLGVLVIWKYKLPRLGLVMIVGGVLWGLIAFKVIIPAFYPGAPNNFLYRYAGLGNTPKEIILNILLHPWMLITLYVTLNRVYYLAGLFRSTFFLSLLAPEWLIPALIELAINLLSTNNTLLYTGIYQYNASIIPFVIMSALQGIQRLVLLWQAWRGEQTLSTSPVRFFTPGASPSMPEHSLVARAMRRGITWLGSTRLAFAHIATAWGISASVAYVQPRLSSLSQMRSVQKQRFQARMQTLAQSVSLPRLQLLTCIVVIAMTLLNLSIMNPILNIVRPTSVPGEREQHIQQLLDMIPQDASVAAGTNMNPHLSERTYITVFPNYTFSLPKSGDPRADYIIVDLINIFPENKQPTADRLKELLGSGQYVALKQVDGVILLVRHDLFHEPIAP